MVYKLNGKSMNILSAVFCLVLLRPHIDFGPPFLAVYLADVLVLILMIFSFANRKIEMEKYQLHDFSIGVFYLFLLFLLLIIHLIIGNMSYDLLFSYFILLYYLLFFWYITIMMLTINNIYFYISKILDVSFIVIFIVALIQLYDLPFLGNFIKLIYGSAKLRDLYSGYARVYSTFFNANWFGVYLVFYLGWVNSNFIAEKTTIKKYFIKMVLLLLLFFSLGSRTALVGGSLIMLIQWIDYRYIRKVLKFLPIIIILVSTIFVGLRNSGFLEKTLNRYFLIWNLLLDVGFDMSVLEPGRWYDWMFVFERFKKNLLFGSGGSGEIIPHNSYLYFIDTFGLAGVCITVLCAVVLLATRRIKKERSVESRISSKWFYSFLISFGVMSIAADFLFTTQVMLLVIISASINYTFSSKDFYYEVNL